MKKTNKKRIDAPILSCQIHGLGVNGEGVGQMDGKTIFVDGALPGEKVSVRIETDKKTYAVAKLLKLEERSPERVEASCSIYDTCGGCQLQHLNYEAQLRAKHERVVQTLARIGKNDRVHVQPVLGMTNPWTYRNKVQVPIGPDGPGFYARNSHSIIPFETCPIQNEQSADLVKKIASFCKENKLPAYDEQTHSGWLRHILVRIAERTNEWMVVLVTKTEQWPSGNEKKLIRSLVQKIQELRAQVVSIQQNINPNRTNVILGNQTKLIWGKEQIVDQLFHPNGSCLSFAISAQAFYQVNTTQMQVLYEQARRYAALSGNEIVIDAYCGIGTIAVYLAAEAKKVYGVEIVPQAIRDAQENATRNGMTHVRFEVGDASEWMAKWLEQVVNADVIVLDPPRKGCDRTLLESANAMQPQRIVYVSCDVATFARDVHVLAEMGWELQEVQPVDLFPQTAHVECVGWFEKK